MVYTIFQSKEPKFWTPHLCCFLKGAPCVCYYDFLKRKAATVSMKRARGRAAIKNFVFGCVLFRLVYLFFFFCGTKMNTSVCTFRSQLSLCEKNCRNYESTVYESFHLFLRPAFPDRTYSRSALFMLLLYLVSLLGHRASGCVVDFSVKHIVIQTYSFLVWTEEDGRDHSQILCLFAWE